MILCDYAKDELNLVHEWYNGVTTKFKIIKKLRLSSSCNGCEIKQDYELETGKVIVETIEIIEGHVPITYNKKVASIIRYYQNQVKPHIQQWLNRED